MSADSRRDRVVVVGAGSAGCVVAARLAEAGVSTVLIEAGPSGRRVDQRLRAGLIDPAHEPTRYWRPLAEVREPAESDVVARSQFWMGRGMGGGSAVNGMLVMPGDRADYDRWAGIDGCAEWSAEAVAPWLAKATTALDPELRPDEADTAALTAAFDEAFARIGLGHAGTTLDRDRCGVLTPVLATRSGIRRSVADAYLPTPDPNLSVLADRTVDALVVEGDSVRGVELADGEIVAASTVVLAAGTVGTAQLLRTTGRVRHVGDWVKNHAAASIPVPWPMEPGSDRAPQVHRVARWTSGAVRSDVAGESGPDLTAILMGPFPTEAGRNGVVIVMASTVRSHGRLDLDGDTRRLISNRLTDPDDAAILRSGTRQVLAVCRQLARLADGTESDGAWRHVDALAQLSDRELDDWLVRHPGPVHHAVGSCRMGAVTEAGSGRAGTIPGLDRVVVADASLFPDLVAGGLQLPVMAVAERVAAETLLGSPGWP